MLGHRLNICGIESTRLEAVKYSSLHEAPATHLCPQTACSFMREVSHKHEIIRQFFTWLRMLYPSTAFWGKKQTNMTSADWDIQKGSLKGRMARILMLRKGKKKKKVMHIWGIAPMWIFPTLLTNFFTLVMMTYICFVTSKKFSYFFFSVIN